MRFQLLAIEWAQNRPILVGRSESGLAVFVKLKTTPSDWFYLRVRDENFDTVRLEEILRRQYASIRVSEVEMRSRMVGLDIESVNDDGTIRRRKLPYVRVSSTNATHLARCYYKFAPKIDERSREFERLERSADADEFCKTHGFRCGSATEMTAHFYRGISREMRYVHTSGLLPGTRWEIPKYRNVSIPPDTTRVSIQCVRRDLVRSKEEDFSVDLRVVAMDIETRTLQPGEFRETPCETSYCPITNVCLTTKDSRVSIAWLPSRRIDTTPTSNDDRFTKTKMIWVHDLPTLLETFAREVRAMDGDVFTGWNTDSFDMYYLIFHHTLLKIFETCTGKRLRERWELCRVDRETFDLLQKAMRPKKSRAKGPKTESTKIREEKERRARVLKVSKSFRRLCDERAPHMSKSEKRAHDRMRSVTARKGRRETTALHQMERYIDAIEACEDATTHASRVFRARMRRLRAEMAQNMHLRAKRPGERSADFGHVVTKADLRTWETEAVARESDPDCRRRNRRDPLPLEMRVLSEIESVEHLEAFVRSYRGMRAPETFYRDLSRIPDDLHASFVASTISSAGGGVIRRRTAKMPGWIRVDGYPLMRASPVNLPNYKLRTVAEKLNLSLLKYDLSYENLFENQISLNLDDHLVTVYYCLTDCNVVREIFKNRRWIDIYLTMATFSGVQPKYSMNGGTMQNTLGVVVAECLKRKMVFNQIHEPEWPESTGACVLNPAKIGFIKDKVAIYDFKSLYPSGMIDLNLCPSTFVLPDDVRRARDILAKHGIEMERVSADGKILHFLPRKNGPSILGSVLSKFLRERVEAKKTMKKWKKVDSDHGRREVARWDVIQMVLKIFCNAVYGWCGARGGGMLCEYVSKSTTAFGRESLRRSCDFVLDHCRKLGLTKVYIQYGDTDSIFVAFDMAELRSYLKIDASIPTGSLAEREITFPFFEQLGEAITEELFRKEGRMQMEMEFENAVAPFKMLQRGKKMYVYEARLHPNDNPKRTVKGMSNRNLNTWTRGILDSVLDIVLESDDRDRDTAVRAYLKNTFDGMTKQRKLKDFESGGLSLDDIARTVEFKGPDAYKDENLQVLLARRQQRRGRDVEPGTRITFWVCHRKHSKTKAARRKQGLTQLMYRAFVRDEIGRKDLPALTVPDGSAKRRRKTMNPKCPRDNWPTTIDRGYYLKEAYNVLKKSFVETGAIRLETLQKPFDAAMRTILQQDSGMRPLRTFFN